MPLRRTLPALAATAATAGLLAVGPAPGASAGDYSWVDQQLPFTCGQMWTGTTRSTHSPSAYAIDFNRDRDLGSLVLASATGVVSRVEDAGTRSYGKWVRIEHADGYSTLYAHLMAQWVVPGQVVDQGDAIGRVGDTGGVSGAHLHYEQRLGSVLRRPVFQQIPFVYGSTSGSRNCGDVPLAGDWDGDGAHQVGVFRRSAGTATFVTSAADGGSALALRFGRPSDLPVSGDWDGDGVTDLGLRRQATAAFLLRGGDGKVTRVKYGFIKDRPVTGDWDGDGATDVGIWRPAVMRFRLRAPDGTSRVVPLGGRGSLPVTGDWDGDSVTDLGVYDPARAMFTLRTVSAAGQVALSTVSLGAGSDLPVTGDWNGDRITDLGVWTPATATYKLRVGGAPTSAPRSGTSVPDVRTFTFGRAR